MVGPPSKRRLRATQNPEILVQERSICCGKVTNEYTQGFTIFKDSDAFLEDFVAEFQKKLEEYDYNFDYRGYTFKFVPPEDSELVYYDISIPLEEVDGTWNVTDLERAYSATGISFTDILDWLESYAIAKGTVLEVRNTTAELYCKECAAKAVAICEEQGLLKEATGFKILKKRNEVDEILNRFIKLRYERNV